MLHFIDGEAALVDQPFATPANGHLQHGVAGGNVHAAVVIVDPQVELVGVAAAAFLQRQFQQARADAVGQVLAVEGDAPGGDGVVGHDVAVLADCFCRVSSSTRSRLRLNSSLRDSPSLKNSPWVSDRDLMTKAP